MKAKELRIGNFIAAYNMECTVICIAKKEIEIALGLYNEIPNREIPMRVDDIDVFLGIKITEKWLLEFGCKEEMRATTPGFYNWSINGKWFQFEESSGAVLIYGVVVYSIHKLQNIYYEHENKDLTYTKTNGQ